MQTVAGDGVVASIKRRRHDLSDNGVWNSVTESGDENPIRTLGDYSKPSHEGYMNTIELPIGNTMVPLRSDTIRRTAKLRNDILMFQQHHGESLSEAWTRFKDLLQKVPHHGIDLWFQVQIFYDHVNPVTRRTIDQAVGDVLSIPDRRLIKLENQVQRLMEAHLAPMKPTQMNKITTLCEICSGPHDTQYCMEDPEQAFVEYASSRTDEAGGKWYTFKPEQNNLVDTYNPSWRSHPNLRKDFLDCHLPGEWEIARDAELNPFKDVLVFRRMDKPPKNKDGAWHAKIRLIDPDGEDFTKTLQSIPTTRKLSEKESPREIIDLDHFYDT
ncbi:MAK10-like protein [Tanacetum coccineum]